MGAVGPEILAVNSFGQGIAGIGSAYAASKAAETKGKFEAQQYATNARLADLNAKDAIARGGKAVDALGRKVSGLVGEQRVAAAASGVDVNSGSAAAIQDQTKELGELDKITIGNNAFREAWGYKVSANSLRGQAAYAELAGENESQNTLLTGGLKGLSDFTKGAYYLGGGKLGA